MGGLWAVEGMEGNTRSTLNLLRCEPGLRRAWQLQAVLRLVTQPQDGTRPPPGEVGARGASAPRTATGAESGIVSSRTGWWRPPPSVMAAGKTTSLARVVPSSMRIVRTVYAEGQPQRELQRKAMSPRRAQLGQIGDHGALAVSLVQAAPERERENAV